MLTRTAGLTYGHHHLNITDLAGHEQFWVRALGGTLEHSGSTPVVTFPGVRVFLRKQPPAGGTKGTVVDHFGFQVVNLRRTIDLLKAAGFPMVTREEIRSAPPEAIKDDIAYVANQDAYAAMTMGPDGMKVEMVEVTTSATPIALHHIHFFTPGADEMRDWYVEHFSATPGMRGTHKTAELPGVSLTMTPSATPVASTRGRAIDHIGFEVPDLEALVGRLEAARVTVDRTPAADDHPGVRTASFTDPWGTFVELTEGLGRV